MALGLFGLYLGLLGYLVFRSGYIPRILGVLLAVSGVGWVIESSRPYILAGSDLGFVVAISSVCELLFMLWLLIRGWRIPEPEARS